MRKASVLPTPESIPYDDFGGSGPLVHFGHANAYPPLAYRPLLERLISDYHVIAMRMRPMWPDQSPAHLPDWRPLSDDLRRFLDQFGSSKPVIGIGHSMGATIALRLALSHPDYFSALVLIDPVIFPPLMTVMIRALSVSGLSNRLHPLARSALRRKQLFDSKQAMFENYRSKSVFQRIDDCGLWCYVESLARVCPNGQVQLAYSPEWEARIYTTGALADMDIWRSIRKLRVPLQVIRGSDSNTFLPTTAQLLKRRLPGAVIQTIPGSTHLLPLEQPVKVAQFILGFIQSETHPTVHINLGL